MGNSFFFVMDVYSSLFINRTENILWTQQVKMQGKKKIEIHSVVDLKKNSRVTNVIL